MYIWTKNGMKLLKTEDIVEIVQTDESDILREKHPAVKGELHVLRAYYKPGDRSKSTILSSHDSYEDAHDMFQQLIKAIGQGITLFSMVEDVDFYVEIEERDLEQEL